MKAFFFSEGFSVHQENIYILYPSSSSSEYFTLKNKGSLLAFMKHPRNLSLAQKFFRLFTCSLWETKKVLLWHHW